MALKATGIVISLESKLLIVGDSVMGCFVQAPGDGDASPGAMFYTLVRVSVIGPGRGNNLACRFAAPFLPARRPVSF
jgi:hypothetical protein